MTKALALLCSPHPNGVSDTVARFFAEGMTEAGVELQTVALRDYAIAPCTGCGACSRAPHACVQANRPMPGQNDESYRDQAEEIFSLIQEAPLIMISSPIYFYHLPAHFKALIDRTQRFWEAADGQTSPNTLPLSRAKPVLAALTAGRPRGKLLFSGALLTLKYALAPLNASIRETRLLRGLDHAKDLHERPAITAALHAWGHDWGRRIMAGQMGVYDLPEALPTSMNDPQ